MPNITKAAVRAFIHSEYSKRYEPLKKSTSRSFEKCDRGKSSIYRF